MKKCLLRPYRQAAIRFTGMNETVLVQPLTYMNKSGRIVRYFIPGHFSVEDLIVVCDNLDLPAGMIRIRKGGSSAGHKGLKSLIEALGSTEFIRVYVGIGRPANGDSVVEYVLGAPENEAACQILRHGVNLAAEAVTALCRGGSIEEVSRAYNRRNRDG